MPAWRKEALEERLSLSSKMLKFWLWEFRIFNQFWEEACHWLSWEIMPEAPLKDLRISVNYRPKIWKKSSIASKLKELKRVKSLLAKMSKWKTWSSSWLRELMIFRKTLADVIFTVTRPFNSQTHLSQCRWLWRKTVKWPGLLFRRSLKLLAVQLKKPSKKRTNLSNFRFEEEKNLSKQKSNLMQLK